MRNTVNEGSENYKDCDEGFDILTTISIEADHDDQMPIIRVRFHVTDSVDGNDLYQLLRYEVTESLAPLPHTESAEVDRQGHTNHPVLRRPRGGKAHLQGCQRIGYDWQRISVSSIYRYPCEAICPSPVNCCFSPSFSSLLISFLHFSLLSVSFFTSSSL